MTRMDNFLSWTRMIAFIACYATPFLALILMGFCR